MSVPKGKRKLSRFEAQHNYYKLRDAITELMLLDFGFSEKKYRESIDYYRRSHESAENIDEVVERFEKKCDSFNKWFIDRECDAVLDILRKIQTEFTLGNSIYPSETPAKLAEFITRRKHMNNAIAYCYALKQEINYIIKTLPVDMNKAERFDEAINEEIKLLKGVRQADNRFLKSRRPEDSALILQIAEAAESIMDIIHKLGSIETKK